MRTILGSLVCTVAVIACTGDETKPSVDFRPEYGITGLCDNNASSVASVWQHWTCGSNVYLDVQSLSTGDRSVVTSATDAWNSQLHSRHPELPKFTTDPNVSPKDFTVTVTATSPGMSSWCGGVSPSGSGRPTSLTVGTTGSGNQCGAPFDVAVHEMSHIAGFGADWHTTGGTILKHCAVALVSGTSNTVNSNGGPCQWEIEVMLALYGVRSSAPDMSKSFITGLTGPSGPSSIQVSDTGTLGYGSYVLARSNGTLCGLTDRDMCGGEYAATSAMTGSLTWQSTSPTVATVTSPGATTIATAVSVGTSTISAIPQSVTAYELATDRSTSRTLTVTPAPPPPPSNITATAITYNSAVINWTNGDALASTVIEYQYTGQSSWSQVSAAAGATSMQLTSLTGSTTYSVRLHHVRSGLSSQTVLMTDLFQTTVAPPASITNFGMSQGCYLSSKGWPTITVHWTALGDWTGTSWEIYSGSTPTGTSLMTSGSAQVTQATKAFSPAMGQVYLFIRTVAGAARGPWVALYDNPMDVSSGCPGL